MILLTKKIREKLIKNHLEQDGSKTFKAEVKLFNPCGIGTWYLSELNPDTNVAFGLCELHEKELGYVSIDELKEIELPFLLKIERDLYFQPTHFSELMQLRGVV
jgi:hypothetical protein